MLRRHLLLGALAAPAAFAARPKIDLSRISLLTDEVGKTPADSIAFAKQYGVTHVELRGVPGTNETYAFLDEARLMATAKEFKEAGLTVSFLNSPMLKFNLPGQEPARKRTETPEQKAKREEREKKQFDAHEDDLKKAIRAAHIFGVKGIRVFTFTRVAEPSALLPKVAEILKPMVKLAQKEGVELLVENEGSCNVATSAELKALCDLVPGKAFGINWDPVNGWGPKGTPGKELPFPDGYALLPKKRVHNVQMKARGLVVGPDFLDWRGIFDALDRDGYKGCVGLETHIFDGTLIEKAHLSIRKIKDILAQ